MCSFGLDLLRNLHLVFEIRLYLPLSALLFFFFNFAEWGRLLSFSLSCSPSRLEFLCGFCCFIIALGCLWWWGANVLGDILPLLSFLFLLLGDSTPSFTLRLCKGMLSMLLYSKWWFGIFEWNPIAEFPPPLGPLLFTLLLGRFPLEVRGLLGCWLLAVVLSPLSLFDSFPFLWIDWPSFLLCLTLKLFLDAFMCSLKYLSSFRIFSISSSSACSMTLLFGLWFATLLWPKNWI